MSTVHLITGDDDLLLQRATERVVSDLTAADPELSVDTYDAAELEALPELRTQSLFGGRVCAVIRGVQGARADLKGELEDYLAAPDDQAVLVLVAQGTGKVQKIARLARQHGEVTKVDTPPDWKTNEWQGIVTGEFRRTGMTATPDAVAAILEHAGLDPSVIAMRVAQVAAATQGDKVGPEDVERVVEGHGRRSGFELADAVAERDPAQAITLLRGTNIQDNCTVHTEKGCPVVIGPDVSVGHGAIIHGSTVHERALIGMNAVILNRAVVGAHAVVGALTLVPDNGEVPPRSLAVGIPCRIIKEDHDGVAGMAHANTERYHRYTREHTSGMWETVVGPVNWTPKS